MPNSFSFFLGSQGDNMDNARSDEILGKYQQQGMAIMEKEINERIDKMNVRLAEMRGYL
jgi:hypothetical protein